MAKMKIRYFVTKPGAGGRPKHFWQPALSLRADGWAPVRLSDNPTIAISEAENINQRLDAWRLGAPIAGAAGGDTDPDIFTTKAQTAVAAVTEGAPGGVSVSAGTIAAVVRSWRQSARYRALRPNSIITYERAIVQLLNTMGDLQVAALTPVLLARFYEIEHTRAPSMANLKMKVLKVVLSFATIQGWIPSNPAAEVRLNGQKPRQKVWSDRALTAVVDAADAIGRPSVGTMVLMAAYLGQRPGDTRRMTWGQYKDGCITLTQQKTRKAMKVPVAPELAERLEAMRHAAAGDRVTATTIIWNDHPKNYGKPYTEWSLRAAWNKVRAVARDQAPELDGLRIADLRRTAVVWMAEADATEAQIAAVTGHNIDSTRHILETYLPRNEVMAAAGIAKLASRRASKQAESAGA